MSAATPPFAVDTALRKGRSIASPSSSVAAPTYCMLWSMERLLWSYGLRESDACSGSK